MKTKILHWTSVLLASSALLLSACSEDNGKDTSDPNTNRITGAIPSEIGKMQNLFALDLSFNEFSGSIPESIGQLQRLYQLYLRHNQLSGSIPDDIGNLTNLVLLDLSENQLSGEIPNSIGNLTGLTYFVLSFNKLSGSIPPEIVNLKKLPELYLNDNQLTGEIPSEFGMMSNLERLILNNNQLSGSIPKELGDMQKLKTLHLGSNQLTGAIPPELGNLSNMREFQLGYNQLSGPIPPEICHFEHIESFYLGENNLTGNLPEEFVNVMPHSGVWHNCLSGEVPSVITEHPMWTSRAPFILPQKEGYGLWVAAYASTDYSEDGKVEILQQATEGDGVNFVLLGDGFTDRDFASGYYEQVMRKAMDNLFLVEPFKSFRHLFNVYMVKVVSKNDIFADGYETALDGYFDGTVGAGGDYEKCVEYASKISGINLSESPIVVIMNSHVHAGSNVWLTDNTAISFCPIENSLDAEEFAQVLHHEALGHAFSKFADEYWYENDAAMPDSEREILKDSHSQGWWLNVDMTADPTEVLWSKFLSDERYANEGLGIFEGAFLCGKNIYRATDNSIMRYNTGGFNAQQREVIYKLIMQRAYGDTWQYDYETFVEYDKINRSTVPVLLRRAFVAPKDFKPYPSPVIIR